MGVLDAIKCALIEIINLLIEHVLNNILAAIVFIIELLPVVNIFPDLPDFGNFFSSIGYFVPIGTMLQHFAVLLAALIIWQSYEYIMRWIKMIK